jgi:hypothetical protein
MAFELKEGQGSLHKNERKTKPGHPDYYGQLNVEGTIMNLSAWIKEAASGKKWMNISMSKQRAKSGDDAGDDTPF